MRLCAIAKGLGKRVRREKVEEKISFEDFVLRDFSDEERKLLDMERDKYIVIQAQIDRLTVHEMRAVESIRKLESESELDESGEPDVQRQKRILDHLKELADIQKRKAQAVKLLHDMSIDDMKYGLVENADAEAAKKHAREVLEALSGDCAEREDLGLSDM